MPSVRRPTSRAVQTGIGWQDAPVAPVVLVSGAEALLAERAVDRIVEQVRERIPDVAVERLDAAEYTPGALAVLTSPSLFSDDKVVVIEGLERALDELLSDAVAYVGAPLDSVVVVLRHGGGARGKRLLDTCRAAGVPTVVTAWDTSPTVAVTRTVITASCCAAVSSRLVAVGPLAPGIGDAPANQA